ncbi:MAG: biosynthetic-type acetolactate synthase large subunit [Candidatus Marinimicrobia bacterium]|nr:biosynthetic-type acetolactate synthase large subunit [Candidatus Neomarinimicrobiota bacterium]MBT6710620.1 biosynthetic-type acetolactate synthase large subunit [Candidatus Neomarinimicrobiota bacterium]MBT7119752.1 biosynthetic-type acetolactate synthase large subunit [Candidatus Neomarinimicrobiota bacterium]MBT7373720.1 biosynthetic-type acetolactate synthase large subunit [Candidatus Neomarinimicrobiota bacterium]
MKKRILTGAEIIWECIIRENIDVVFGYPGGTILPAYDALNKYRDKIHHVLVRHEQGATHMADGYARASGKVGVAMATSGPGATNMVTGLATAKLDSIPIVCITGQVPRAAIGSDAFQEVDISGTVLPVTKYSYLVMDINNLASTIKEAFAVARSGRPGPVLIDIPKDVQNDTIEFVYPDEPVRLPGNNHPIEASEKHIQNAADLINNAKKPVILAGHGILLSGASQEIIKLAETASIPIGWTLLGAGSVPASHPLNMGMMGMHGEFAVNNAIQDADLLIACGMRFDDRVTGNIKTYSPDSKKIHIDIDPSEINKNVPVDVGISCDLRTAMTQLLPHISRKQNKEWLKTISGWQSESLGRDIINVQTDTLYGAQVIRDIWKETNGDALIVTDVGQHQMLEAQYYDHEEPNTLLTSGGLGTMGYSLPAAIGASFSRQNKDIWVIVGDGSIQMTITELATAVQENANIKIAIINNGYLGMVRQWQQLFYDARYAETPISSPDYLKIAEAYGLPGYRVNKRKEIPGVIQKVKKSKGPVLVEFVVEQHDMVYPMVPAGAALNAMISRPKNKQFQEA